MADIQQRTGVTTISSGRDLDSVVLGLAEPAMLIGSKHRVLIANDRANALFGWEDTGLAGQSVKVLMPESMHTSHSDRAEGYFNRRAIRPMGDSTRIEAVRRTGERIQLDISLTPIELQGELVMLVTVRDVQAAASRISTPLNEPTALSELARLVSGPTEAAEVYRRMACQIRPLILYDQLLLCAFDRNTSILRDLCTVGQESTGGGHGLPVTLTDSQASGLRSMTRPAIFVGGAVPGWFAETAGNQGSGDDGFRSLLSAPLRWNGKVIGILNIRSRNDSAYSDESLKLAEQIATLLASVVARSRSRTTAAEATDQRTVLAGIGRLVGSAPDIRRVFESLATQIDRLIPIDRLAFTSVGPERGRYFLEAEWGPCDPTLLPGIGRSLAGTGTEVAILAGRPVILTEDQIQTISRHNHPVTPGPMTMKSWLTTPFKLRGETIGVMHFRSYEPDVYEAAHIEIAQDIAAQFAGAFGNATVTHDGERERKIHNSVIELTWDIVRGDQLAAIAGAVKDQLSKLVDFDRFSVATVDQDRDESEIVYESGVKLDGIDTDRKFQFAGLITRGGSRIDTVGENGEVWRDRLARAGLNSWMYTVIGDDTEQPVGTIWVGASRHGAFTECDLETLDRLTGVMVPLFHGFTQELARRRLVEERERSEALARQTAVLEFEARAKSEFVSSISHEFKTPLTSVIAFSDLLRRDSNMTEHQLKHVKLIQNNAWRLERMIEDLLEIAMANAGRLSYEISEVHVTDIVQEVCESLRLVAKNAGRRLLYNCSETVATAAVDPIRLAQAVQNLISNAINYSPTRTGITVTANEAHGQFLVRVRNRGTLTAEQVRDAFIRFKRLDNEITRGTPGTGLGLPISRQIIEEMGGTVILESKSGFVEARLCVPVLNSGQS